MGADEFLLLIPDFDSESAENLSVELMRAIELPLVMGYSKVRLTFSIGIAVMELEESTTELIERADWGKIRQSSRVEVVLSFLAVSWFLAICGLSMRAKNWKLNIYCIQRWKKADCNYITSLS